MYQVETHVLKLTTTVTRLFLSLHYIALIAINSHLHKAPQYMTDCCIHTSDIARRQHLQVSVAEWLARLTAV